LFYHIFIFFFSFSVLLCCLYIEIIHLYSDLFYFIFYISTKKYILLVFCLVIHHYIELFLIVSHIVNASQIFFLSWIKNSERMRDKKVFYRFFFGCSAERIFNKIETPFRNINIPVLSKNKNKESLAHMVDYNLILLFGWIPRIHNYMTLWSRVGIGLVYENLRGFDGGLLLSEIDGGIFGFVKVFSGLAKGP